MKIKYMNNPNPIVSVELSSGVTVNDDYYYGLNAYNNFVRLWMNPEFPESRGTFNYVELGVEHLKELYEIIPNLIEQLEY